MAERSDALVFFGATGDLAYKQIFPALQAMVVRGHLNVPIVGVAKAGGGLDQLLARARDSLAHHSVSVDEDAFASGWPNRLACMLMLHGRALLIRFTQDAEQLRAVGVLRGGAHTDADPGEPEERPQSHDDDRNRDEDHERVGVEVQRRDVDLPPRERRLR